MQAMEASSLCKRKGKRVNKMRELRQTTLQFVPVFASLPLHCTLSSSSRSTQQPVCVCLVSSTRGTSLWGEAPRRLAWFIPWADDHADVVIIYLSVCLEKVLRFLILYWSFSSGCHCQPASLRKAKQTHTVLPTRQTHTVCGMEAFANDNHFRSGLAPSWPHHWRPGLVCASRIQQQRPRAECTCRVVRFPPLSLAWTQPT